MYSANDIAKWFVNRACQDVDAGYGEYMTHLKLQKMLYYAQGCSLGMYGKKLFKEKILHWEHGPVVSEVYHNYKDYGFSPIKNYSEEVKIEAKDESLLEEVYAVFGKYSATALRDKTHKEAPWAETQKNEEIGCEAIKKYFFETYIAE
ncbi:MAG: SocA family protein [Clostridia bacterium]|nr:SocA family protein [Clostridia bacterium]MCX4367565.1 DUF4065 domain-containing protein [Clostridia bacterium]